MFSCYLTHCRNPKLVKALLTDSAEALAAAFETADLYNEVVKKFDVYHLAIDDKATSYSWYKDKINKTFGKY